MEERNQTCQARTTSSVHWQAAIYPQRLQPGMETGAVSSRLDGVSCPCCETCRRGAGSKHSMHAVPVPGGLGGRSRWWWRDGLISCYDSDLRLAPAPTRAPLARGAQDERPKGACACTHSTGALLPMAAGVSTAGGRVALRRCAARREVRTWTDRRASAAGIPLPPSILLPSFSPPLPTSTPPSLHPFLPPSTPPSFHPFLPPSTPPCLPSFLLPPLPPSLPPSPSSPSLYISHSI
jgi:hypothetical protein